MKFSWKRAWATTKQIARVLGAIGGFIGALVALWPHLKAAWIWLGQWSAPYLLVLAPYRWLIGTLLLIVGIYFAITVRNARIHETSVLTVLSSHLTLDIADVNGKSATLLHHTNLRADVDDVEAYRHRVWGIGTMDPPEIKLLDYGYRISEEVSIEAGMTCYDLLFIPPLQKGRTVWQTWKSELKDSFTKSNEYLSHSVVYREKDLRMEVIFPVNHGPKSAVAVLIIGHSKQRIGELEIATKGNRARTEWRVERPVFGYTYRIEWEW